MRNYHILIEIAIRASIKAGIDWIKRYKVYIHPESTNFLKEFKSYKWKVDKNERVLEDPVDINNHLIDAFRYALTELIKYGGEDFNESSLKKKLERLPGLTIYIIVKFN